MSTETKQVSRSSWRPIVPVDDDAPAPRFTHTQRGEPVRVHHYQDAQGRTLGYVCRFVKSSGGITSMTRTWCVNEADQSRSWRWIQFPKLRPIFGAELLVKDVPDLVVIVGSEEAAMAMRQLPEFAAFTFVSWPGGAAKIGEVDWSPLRSKLVVVWLPHSAERFKVAKGDPQAGDMMPPQKQPWRAAAQRLKETLTAFGAVPMSTIEAATLEELPDGFDQVRALDEGWSGARLHEWYEAHLGSDSERAEVALLGASTPSGAAPGGEEWMRTLMRHRDTQELLAELHNVRLILDKHEAWKGVIFFDEFAHQVRKRKPPPFEGSSVGEWSDYDDSMAADWIASQCGIRKLRTTLVAEAVEMVAKLNRHNPVQSYLRELKWDGTPRLASWLVDYLGAGPFTERMGVAEIEARERYYAIVGTCWLMGAVKRALEPGCKFDYVLILEGKQGLGKSTAFQVLGGEWAMDTPFDLGDKEGMENIRGKWIVEIPELDAFHKSASTTAKAFFARGTDRFRMPYGKRSMDFQRVCVFGATSNHHEYLRDPTGNRRYWPVEVGSRGYDLAKLTEIRDQLMAEAVVRVKRGESYWPTREDEARYIRPEQKRREIMDPWTAAIAGWLDTADAAMGQITRNRILREALKIDASRLDEKGMATRVGIAMERLGYERIEDKSLPDRFRYEKRRDG